MTTDPDVWFVDPASATSGNLVTPLIDGISMMTEFQNQVNQLGAGDFLFLAAWQLEGATTLPGATQRLVDDLIDKHNAGADIRFLLYRGMPTGIELVGLSSSRTVRAEHLALKALIEPLGIQLLIDLNLPTQLGSHHSKYAIFGKQAAGGYLLTAFCGGIDIGGFRKDDAAHQRVLGGSESGLLGWHDIHAKIEGPEAETIFNDFVRRWNDHPDAATDYKTATTQINTNLTFQLPPLTDLPHRVEVLYNYHCSNYIQKPRGPRDTAEEIVYYGFVNSGGIHTILSAYLQAIAAAKHYIYIENLFFYEEQISTALRDKLNEVDSTAHIILVTNFGHGSDGYVLRQNLNIVRESPNALFRFHVCGLRHTDGNQDPIYIHSKLMIVDDQYFTVGSANLSPRSMSYDTEINIGVLGEDLIDYEFDNQTYTVSQTVRDFRVALWREHLQIAAPTDGTEDSLIQIPSARQTWVTHIDDLSSRVCSNEPTGNFLTPVFYLIAHPSETCD